MLITSNDGQPEKNKKQKQKHNNNNPSNDGFNPVQQ
jgi:hypothetical protein